jgi:hypothetical protein
LARIRAAAEEVKTCEDALDAARERLTDAVRAGIDEGLSWRVAATAAGRSGGEWVASQLARRAAG